MAIRTMFGALFAACFVLASCTQLGPAPATVTPDDGKGELVTPTTPVVTASLPTPAPIVTAVTPGTTPAIPTMTAPTAPPATAVPTAAPPTATLSPAADLLGPEWTVAALGDANLDGRVDVIGFKPAALAPRQPSADFPIVASEIVIVQRNDAGQPELQLAANAQQIVVPGQMITTFAPSAQAAAYQVRTAPGTNTPLALVPLGANGEALTLAGGFSWNYGAGRYSLVGAPVGTPGTPSGPLALVGNEWAIAVQGDFNGNGRREVVAYKGSGVVPQQPGNLPLVISEAVIVEEGPLGRAELQLALNSSQLSVPGQALATFPPGGQPAAFQSAIQPGGVILTIVPLLGNGRPLAPGGRIVWDAGAQGYRLTADSNLVPQPRQLLGPEWTVLADGDANFDGRRDVIAYKPSGIVPRPPSPDFRYTAVEIVIVQENAGGPYLDPDVQLAINTRQAWAAGVQLASYPGGFPGQSVAAFQLRLQPGTSAPLAIIPITDQGASLSNLASSVYWDGFAGGYRFQPLAQPPTPLPATVTPTPPPATVTPTPPGNGSLLGPEWSILAQGDINGDGRRDVAGYKPATVPFSVQRYPDLVIQQNASEMVIVQAGPAGQPELQLAVSPSQVIVPGQTLFTYNPPAAFFSVALRVTQASDAALVRFTPYNAQGQALSGPVTLAWDAGRSLYVIQVQPSQPRGLPPGDAGSILGAGWKPVWQGDINNDGLPDEIAYVEAATPPAQSEPTRPYAATQIVVAQRAADGSVQHLLDISQQFVRVPGQTLIDYTNPALGVAGFQLGVDPNSGLIVIAPYDTSGAPVGQVVQLVWDPNQSGFRLAPGR